MKKREQLFVLLLLFISSMAVLCITGCGKNSCEGIMFKNVTEENIEAVGISVPGCGGILTSGEGCDSACWPQSIKLFKATKSEIYNDESQETVYMGCDNQYYGSGCFGCGQVKKNSYIGTRKVGTENIVIFFGSSDKEEKMFGIGNRVSGCAASDANGKYMIDEFEYQLGIQ